MKRLVLEASQREEDGESGLNRPRNPALSRGGPPKPPGGSGHGHGYYSRGGSTQAGQVQQRCGTRISLKYCSVHWMFFCSGLHVLYVPIYVVYVLWSCRLQHVLKQHRASRKADGRCRNPPPMPMATITPVPPNEE